ncbi:hypothetical protein SH661x_003964 [Planctomicrobium sp. SH661]|uniref:hypothetical protein n=1 Tax=Planctomicrobium sp. SH661 TaxID=3448124 RepID=UPI003F5C7371
MTLLFLSQIAVATLLALSLLATLTLGNPVTQTSLTPAWRWGQAAQFAWFLSSTAAAASSPGSPLMDQAWLWTAILTLCPLIAVLGARRPATRVWSWFIILPLIAVLGWPGLTVFSNWPSIPPLRIQAPVCIGFGLVTVMGVGNYLGTRYSLPAVLAGLAVALCLAPLTTFWQVPPPTAAMMRVAAGMVLVSGIGFAIRQGLREGTEESPYDRLWFDFRDTFGIVWSIRIQERINQIAEKENWSSRLGPNGFEWNLQMPVESRTVTETRMDHALRWHLRRFVDPEWIDERVGVTSTV